MKHKAILLLIILLIGFKLKAQMPNLIDKDKKASLDKEFIDGSKIDIQHLTATQSDNLVVLAKIWGFLKYHHPVASGGDYNWDFELFRVMPRILAVKTAAERNDIFSNWIAKLGPYKIVVPTVFDASKIKYKPNLQWITTSGFSKKLINELNNIRKADRPVESYYVRIYNEETPIAIFRNEAAYAGFKYPDAGYRLLGLFRFWNIYEYFSPYKNIIDKSWDNVLKEYVPKFATAKDELSYKLTVAAFIAETQDSHSDISPYDAAFRNYFGAFKPNIEITFVNNQPVVSYSNDEVIGINSLKKGDIIQSINNISVAQLIKEKRIYFTGSNQPSVYRKLAAHFLRTNDTVMNVSYIRNEKTAQTVIKCFPYNKMNYRKPIPTDTGFKIINGNIAYFHPGRLGNKLQSVMPVTMKSKAIIIDMRTYPKPTSFAWDIAKYLFTKPMDIARYTEGSTETPGLFTFMSDDYMKQTRIGEVKTENFKGQVIVLVNEETQSLAELSTMALSTRPNTLIVGSQTSGADGTVGMAVTFPGGLSTGFTQIGVYYPNGKETQRIGIVPDVEVKLTIDGLKEGKDEILEKAISLIK